MCRTILHCDCNGFFASVEASLRPELKTVPMAVCGSTENRHGIVLAKNELAKKFNIQTAETVWSAKRKCPDLVLVEPHHDLYRELSLKINDLYLSYTDMVEPFGIDESWLDVTASHRLFGDGKTIADKLRKQVRENFGITISVGVSFNKIFAKLGSDYKKPDATTVINRENFKKIVFPLRAADLLYVGKSTAAHLEIMGIKTIGDLAESDPQMLKKLLGKIGPELHDYANGLDCSPVRVYGEHEEVKSVGNGITFRRDLVGIDDIKTALTSLADVVAARMRKNGVKGTTLQLTFKNTALKSITRQKPLNRPTYAARDLLLCAVEIVNTSWNTKTPLRALTLTCGNLVNADSAPFQLSLLDSETDERRDEKINSLESSIDEIREKFGKSAVRPASVIKNDMGID